MAEMLRVFALDAPVVESPLLVESGQQGNSELLWNRARRALDELRECGCQAPLVIVSGIVGEEAAVADVQEGTIHFVVNGRLQRLGQAARHVVSRRRLLNIQQKTETRLQERRNLIQLSADIGLALNRSNTLRDMLQNCTQSMVETIEAAFARIWTLRDDQQILDLQASAGIETCLDGPDSKVPIGIGKVGLIALERSPYLTNDVLNDPQVCDHSWGARENMVAFAGYPLIVENRLVGVMTLFARHQLMPATLDAMATVANQIAAGIERKRSEERLHFTQFTIDHVATPVFWTDERGRFFDVNDAACRVTGYSRDELLSLQVSDVNPAIQREGWEAAWAEFRQRGSLTLESILVRKDGGELPVSISSNLLQVGDRECSCTFLQDITEKKRAEQAQRASDLRFRALLNHLQLQIERMPLAYVLFDSDFRIVDWNPAAQRIFGYSKEEMIESAPPHEKLVPKEMHEEMAKLRVRIRAGDMAANFVNDNLTKDKRRITCEWFNTPIMDDQGQLSGLMCLAQDVTERRQLEEQLRQSQKMEAIGQLAGGVAHDFNNLLTIITGYSDVVLADLRAGDPLREHIEEIGTAATRAASLTRQLLAFSRKQVLAPLVLNPNALVGEMEKMLRRLIGEDINLLFQPVDSLWHVRVDPGQIEQVIMNLAVNARDAMPRGGELSIRTKNVVLDATHALRHLDARKGEYVLLSVGDTGCGMTPEILSKVFQPFFTTKTSEKGTGLGLATVYGIVKQSGGFAEVESEPGTGTTFKIYLPRELAEATHKEPTAGSAKVRGTETVLLVEDEDGVRALARHVLQKGGYKVLEARHGGEALLTCEQYQDPIHLLATDVVMPQMSGRELADRLLPLRPRMKVLYLSGYMDDAIVRHGLAKSELPFLQKPYTPDALTKKVREVLDTIAS